MLKPKAHVRYNGTAVFVVIKGIKEIAAATAYSCLVELNGVVGDSSLVKKVGRAWVGSTISGLFVLIPDEANLTAHTYLAELFSSCMERGLPVRCGVAYGRFICVEDADGKLNFAGKAINTAARLAYEPTSVGCLVDSAYEEHVEGFDSKVLELAPKCFVRGKEHDVGFNCRMLGPPTLPFLDEIDEKGFAAHAVENRCAGLIIAYDLPRFTAGDESEVDKRVRSLVDAFRSFKENKEGLGDVKMHFCPGGDGGIVVLERAKEQAYEIGVSLARAFFIESEYKEDAIALGARIGLHYGLVALYNDVSGTVRPTGKACFVADDLTSDDLGKKSGLVFSEALMEAISGGSDKTLQREFEELSSLKAGPAAGVRRFAQKLAGQPEKYSLISQLFGPGSSWRLDS